MVWIYAVFVALWIALLPPFFTAGACTAAFEAESTRLQADIAKIGTVPSALQYWSNRALPVATLSVDQCLKAKPRFLGRCGSGPLVYVRVPVENRVCRLYRDDEIRVQLQYDGFGRLARIATDMEPFKTFPVPFTGKAIHWAR